MSGEVRVYELVGGPQCGWQVALDAPVLHLRRPARPVPLCVPDGEPNTIALEDGYYRPRPGAADDDHTLHWSGWE